MFLGRVMGTVVATRKYEGLDGYKLLLVEPLDHARRPTGPPLVAVDVVRAGPGDLVHLADNREGSLALDPWFVPVDAAVVGIVDDVDAAAPSPGGPPAFGPAGAAPDGTEVRARPEGPTAAPDRSPRGGDEDAGRGSAGAGAAS